MLQPTSWVKAKERRKFKAYQLYLHALVHGVLIMLLVWKWAFLSWAILFAGMHLLIDGIKLLLLKDKTKRIFFFADQFAHVLSIYLLFCAYSGYTEINASLFNEANFLLVTMLLFLTTPASYMVDMFIDRWAPHTEESSTDSLQDAGKFIGILERLLTFVFVITGHWEAVGFLLAAKSIFRFGDLKKPRDRKLTEYILIGTLLSFGLAILTAMAYAALRPE